LQIYPPAVAIVEYWPYLINFDSIGFEKKHAIGAPLLAEKAHAVKGNDVGVNQQLPDGCCIATLAFAYVLENSKTGREILVYVYPVVVE
jgi:hypothetical protein